jgi:hypothetical protein
MSLGHYRPSRSHSHPTLLVAAALFFLGLGLGLSGCSQQDEAADLGTGDLLPQAKYKIHVSIALQQGPQGVTLRTQNGGMVNIPTASIVGKNIGWTILMGGDQVGNGQMLEVGGGVIDPQLQATFTTQNSYPDGAWELALLILLASPDLAHAPHPGDLAAFSVFPPPAGEPPLTGTSVRVTIADADAQVDLDNFYFIQL